MFLTYYIQGSLTLFQNFHGKTPPDLLRAVDLCLEYQAISNIIFALWLIKFSSLGILQNLDVSESALKHKQIRKKFVSIRGRQATVNALIGTNTIRQ